MEFAPLIIIAVVAMVFFGLGLVYHYALSGQRWGDCS
jgi:hypothetical protein